MSDVAATKYRVAARQGRHEAQHASASAPSAAPAEADREIREHKIAGITVPLPVLFRVGEPHTAESVMLAHTMRYRQFNNNMTANSDARAKRLADAKNDAERAANQPYTAAEIAQAWLDYKPALDGATRQSSEEKAEQTARYNAYVQAVLDHNAAVAAGDTAGLVFSSTTIVRNGFAVPAKTKDQTEEAYKALREEILAKRTAFLEKFASMPKYQGRVEAERAKLVAAAGKSKAKGTDTVAVAAGEDIL
jgi:hypothetical protein